MRYLNHLRCLVCLFFLCVGFSCQLAKEPPPPSSTAVGNSRPSYALAIHGGAGAIPKATMTPEKEQQYKMALDSALTIGEQILKNGGTSLDAVSATIVFLENCPLFNAGKGAVFTHEGKNELDASIMEGTTQKAGAVGGVTRIKNPVLLARAVMEHSPHVFLSGKGAEQFAFTQGFDTIAPTWFYTKERWDLLQKVKKEERTSRQQNPTNNEDVFKDLKFGTVGCVAMDQQGHLASATSTGGMTNKRWNRLGDTPIIGAGTYADDEVCAVSCTGHGEYFIRYVVAHDVWALVNYKGLSLQDACNEVVMNKLVKKGGEGGLIAIDKYGNIAQPFNTEGMYRASAKPGMRTVGIYKE
jgi:L-asparaginase / beta-aspartyl-peptidase